MANVQEAGTQAAVGSTESAFPPFDSHNYVPTVFWLIITFGLLYLLMQRYALPRVQSILKTRSDNIHGNLAAARNMRKEAQEASDAYEKTLAEAKSRSQALAHETREKVKAEQDVKRKSLEAELDGKLGAAELRIAETKANAMSNVGQIATEAAAAIIQHIAGKPADPEAVAKAVSQAGV